MLSIIKSQTVQHELETRGYCFVPANSFQITNDLQQSQGALWDSWSTLEEDRYIKGAYQFRFRRYGRFLLSPPRQLVTLHHTAFYQSKDNNSYAGGMAREFAPLLTQTISNRFLAELIHLDFDLLPISADLKEQPWEVDVHQYRVIGEDNHAGYPTPEGIHRDGFDYFAVHLVKKVNVSGGISQIYNNEQQLVETLVLDTPMDSLLVNDARVLHAVTPIVPIDPAGEACRDVLVMNFISTPRDANSAKFNEQRSAQGVQTKVAHPSLSK